MPSTYGEPKCKIKLNNVCCEVKVRAVDLLMTEILTARNTKMSGVFLSDVLGVALHTYNNLLTPYSVVFSFSSSLKLIRGRIKSMKAV